MGKQIMLPAMANVAGLSSVKCSPNHEKPLRTCQPGILTGEGQALAGPLTFTGEQF